ncbi:hypothetical protein BOX37_26695 [Nocardia mangyaensis]|uniref:Uncharacterized protein n=1 Tax=Nocardia mangyaensis TaxID=2213200 RepID=A0A1J0VXV9_9NOCA|nr:hypothetical protein [Nocardia mangyaensis]APE36928.1 hypothetical protein BOX37_26695 [Nocardia mangyaensis]
MGNWFVDALDGVGGDIAVGVAGAAGFAIGGPAGAALLGGAVGLGVSAARGNTGTDLWADAGIAAGSGLLGGSLGSLGMKVFTGGGWKAIGNSLVREGTSTAGKGIAQIPGVMVRGAMRPLAKESGRRGRQVLLRGGAGSFLGAGLSGLDLERLLNLAPQESGPVPVIDYTSKLIETGRLTVDSSYTAHVYGPDRSSANWPDGLELLSEGGEKKYEDFTESVYTSWEVFGRGARDDVPASSSVQQVSGATSAAIISYVASAQELESKYDDLIAADEALGLTKEQQSVLLEEVARISDASRAQLEGAVAGLRDFATANPMDVQQLSLLLSQGVIESATGPMEEDEFVTQLIDNHLVAITGIMDAATVELQTLATQVEELTADDPGTDDTDSGDAGDAGNTDADERGGPHGTPYPYPYPYPNQNQNQNQNQNGAGTQGGTFQPIDFGLDGTQDTVGTSGLTGNPRATQEDIGDERTVSPASPTTSTRPPTPSSTPTPAPTPVAAPTPISSTPSTNAGMGDISPLVSSLLNQNRNNPMAGIEQEPAYADRRPDVPGAVQTGPAAPPPSAQPAASQQQTAASGANTSATNTSATNTPAGTTSSAPRTSVSSTQPMLRPNTDKPPVYIFPDGRPQEVSPVVYAALDAAFDNAAGTDALAAYENTAVALTERNLGDPRDPYQLVTGDIAKFDQRTALVVAFGTESSETPEVIVDGQLQPFSAEIRDKQGDFGPFAGFFHPPGIDIVGTAPETAATDSAAPAETAVPA